MKFTISPRLPRVASILVFGILMALRAEMASHWVRALLAGTAFVILGVSLHTVPRPLNFSLHARRLTRPPAVDPP